MSCQRIVITTAKDELLTELRIKSQNNLSQVRNQIEDIAFSIDKEICQQVMDREGLEGDICPSPSRRRRSKKRVTFAPMDTDVSKFDPQSRNCNLDAKRQPILADDSCDNKWEDFSDCNSSFDLEWPGSIENETFQVHEPHSTGVHFTDDKLINADIDASWKSVSQGTPCGSANAFDELFGEDVVLPSCSLKKDHSEDDLAESLVRKTSLESITDLNGSNESESDVDSWAQGIDEEGSSENISVASIISPNLSFEEDFMVKSFGPDELPSNNAMAIEDSDATCTNSEQEQHFSLSGCDVLEGNDKLAEYSFDDESDDELEHQEYIKKMTELEFTDKVSPCDSTGAIAKTLAQFDFTDDTAETEALTTEGDSDTESSLTREADGRLGISEREEYSLGSNSCINPESSDPQKSRSVSPHALSQSINSSLPKSSTESNFCTEGEIKYSRSSIIQCTKKIISDPKDLQTSSTTEKLESTDSEFCHIPSKITLGEEIATPKKYHSQEESERKSNVPLSSGNNCSKRSSEPVNTPQLWHMKASRIKSLKNTTAWKRRYRSSLNAK